MTARSITASGFGRRFQLGRRLTASQRGAVRWLGRGLKSSGSKPALVLLPLLCASARAQSSPPDIALWSAIEALSRPAQAGPAYESHFAAERERRQLLLEKVRLYRRLYPGGQQCDAALE